MGKYLNLRDIISLILVIAFLFEPFGNLSLAQAEAFGLPAPGVMLALSPTFAPPILKGVKVNLRNPFRFEFILEQGDHQRDGQELKAQSVQLIKYFLASLTIPEKDLWVNLSPYEKDRVIPNVFGQTDMGRDLLAEDYMLKQITASLIYPEGETGKKFWKRVYGEAVKRFGTTDIPVSTFNKVWIVPDKAVVYENAKAATAYIVQSQLKVMLDQDYLAMEKNTTRQAGCQSNNLLNLKAPQGKHCSTNNNTNESASQMMREIVIPELDKEVNQGENFAQLRQVYNSLILASWYKKKIRDSILGQVYTDKDKVSGLLSPGASVLDPTLIYQRYLKAFKKGVYNYIKEENDPLTQQPMPRKYFSGGINATHLSDMAMQVVNTIDSAQLSRRSTLAITADLTIDRAMAGHLQRSPAQRWAKELELLDSQESPINKKQLLALLQAEEGFQDVKALHLQHDVERHKALLGHRNLKYEVDRRAIAARRALLLGILDAQKTPITRKQLLALLRTHQGYGNAQLEDIQKDMENDKSLREHVNLMSYGQTEEVALRQAKEVELLDRQALPVQLSRVIELLREEKGYEEVTKDTVRNDFVLNDLLKNHDKYKSNGTIDRQFDALIGKISNKLVNASQLRGLLRNFRIKGELLFKDTQVDQMMRWVGLVDRLTFLKNILSYRSRGNILFNPSTAFALTLDFKFGTQENIYATIGWLVSQEISKGDPLFTGDDIKTIIFSNQRLDVIKALVPFLLQKKAVDGQSLFNGTNIALIIFGRHQMGEIDQLIEFLGSGTNGNKRFNGSQLSSILASRMDVETKKAIIGFLCKKGYGEADIATIMRRKISLDDVQRLDAFMRKEGIFTGYNMSNIIYSGASVNAKMDLIRYLLSLRDDEGERVFNGYDVQRIVRNGASSVDKQERVQYFISQKNVEGHELLNGSHIRLLIDNFNAFNKPVFETVLKLFKETDVANNQAFYWALRSGIYGGYIRQWLDHDFKDMPIGAQQVIYRLFYNSQTEGLSRSFTTQFDVQHLGMLFDVLFTGKELDEMKRKLAHKQERMGMFLDSIALRGLQDGDEPLIRSLLTSPQLDQRRAIISKIVQSLNKNLVRMQQVYIADGDSLFWIIFNRYNWLRPSSSLSNLQFNLNYVLSHKDLGRRIVEEFKLSGLERRMISRLRYYKNVKKMSKGEIEDLFVRKGYSRQFIVQALRGFSSVSLDKTVGYHDQRTGYDFVSASDLDPELMGAFAQGAPEDNDHEFSDQMEDAEVMVEGHGERVMVSNLLDALTAWLNKIHASGNLRYKVNQAAMNQAIGFKVNGHIVGATHAKDYFIESGDVIEILFPFAVADSAQVTAEKGGIDLTRTKVDVNESASGGMQFHLDPTMREELKGASGFTPVIVNIRPIKELRVFLGLTA